MHAVLGSRRWGHAAAAWAGLFAALHLFWAAGGAPGLAESAGRELAAERPLWFVAAGLYGVALALVAAAALGVLLARSPLPGRAGPLLPLLGAGIAVLLSVRAVGIQALLLTDAGYGGGAVSPAQRWWTLLLWNPWFLFGGLLFGLAAGAARRSLLAAGRRNYEEVGP